MKSKLKMREQIPCKYEVYSTHFFIVLRVSLKSQTLTHAVVMNKTCLGISCYIVSVKAELQLSPSAKTQIMLN